MRYGLAVCIVDIHAATQPKQCFLLSHYLAAGELGPPAAGRHVAVSSEVIATWADAGSAGAGAGAVGEAAADG